MKKILFISLALLTFLLIFNISVKPTSTVNQSSASSLSLSPESAKAFSIGDPSVVTKVLTGQEPQGAWVHSLYSTCLGVLNLLLVIILFVFAFANILHINIETYSIKKVLPKIIIVAVAANLAMPIGALASKMVDSLQTISLFKPSDLDFWYITRTATSRFGGFAGGSATAAIAIIGLIIAGGVSGGLGCVVGALIFLGGIIIVLLLNLLLAFRPYIIFLAMAISPIGIALTILPQTQQWFKKWLGVIVPWMFMPLVVYGLINLGYRIPTNTNLSGYGVISSIVGFFLPALIKAGLLLMAIRFPFMIEKDITGVLAKAGKWAGDVGFRSPDLLASGIKYNNTIGRWNKKAKDELDAGKPLSLTSRLGKGLMDSSKRINEGIPIGIKGLGRINIPLNISHAPEIIKARQDKIAQKRFIDFFEGESAVAIGGRMIQLGLSETDKSGKAANMTNQELMAKEGREIVTVKDENGNDVQQVRIVQGGELDKLRRALSAALGKDGGDVAWRELKDENGRSILADENGNFDESNAQATLDGSFGPLEQAMAAWTSRYIATQSKTQRTLLSTELHPDQHGLSYDKLDDLMVYLLASKMKSGQMIEPLSVGQTMMDSPDVLRAKQQAKRIAARRSGERQVGSAAGFEAEDEPTGTDNEEVRNDHKILATLDPQSMSELADALVKENTLTASPGNLMGAVSSEMKKLSQDFKANGGTDEGFEKLVQAYKTGGITNKDNLLSSNILPIKMANKVGEVMTRLNKTSLYKSMALRNAGQSEGARDTAIVSEKIAPHYQEIAQDGGKQLEGHAQNIILHEQSGSGVSEVALNTAKQYVARQLGIDSSGVTGSIAGKTVKGFEALKGVPETKRATVTHDDPSLVYATARQAIRDELAQQASVSIENKIVGNVAAAQAGGQANG
jgi:hypothetical protein